jgi:hypothetical protein
VGVIRLASSEMGAAYARDSSVFHQGEFGSDVQRGYDRIELTERQSFGDKMPGSPEKAGPASEVLKK